MKDLHMLILISITLILSYITYNIEKYLLCPVMRDDLFFKIFNVMCIGIIIILLIIIITSTILHLVECYNILRNSLKKRN